MQALPATRIHVHEVAPRDGLQMESVFVPTDAKVAWIDQLSALGYAKIEVTSFVSASAIPGTPDGEVVIAAVDFRRALGFGAVEGGDDAFCQCDGALGDRACLGVDDPGMGEVQRGHVRGPDWMARAAAAGSGR